MQIQTEQLVPFLFDPDGPTVRVIQLSKAERTTLSKAADILEELRTAWDNDDHPLDTDVALAMYVIRELVGEPRLEA